MAWNHLSPGVVVESWLAALISQFRHGLATAVWAQKNADTPLLTRVETAGKSWGVQGIPNKFWLFIEVFSSSRFQIKFGCSFFIADFVHHLVSETTGFSKTLWSVLSTKERWPSQHKGKAWHTNKLQRLHPRKLTAGSPEWWFGRGGCFYIWQAIFCCLY